MLFTGISFQREYDAIKEIDIPFFNPVLPLTSPLTHLTNNHGDQGDVISPKQ